MHWWSWIRFQFVNYWKQLKLCKFYILVTPDDRKVISIVKGIGYRKIIQEEREIKTKKIIAIITHELDENDRLISVSSSSFKKKFPILI